MSFFFLTLIDVICTAIGISKGFVREGNPLLANFFHKTPATAAVTVAVFVTTLLYILYKLQYRVRWMNRAANLMLVIKTFAMVLHINWIFHVLFYSSR